MHRFRTEIKNLSLFQWVSKSHQTLLQLTPIFAELCRIQSSSNFSHPSTDHRKQFMFLPSSLHSLFTIYRSSPHCCESLLKPKLPTAPHISLPTPPFSQLHIPVICLTLSMWQWSASNTDSESCLIEKTVHLFHHLPQRTYTHNHYLKHKTILSLPLLRLLL